MTTQWFCPHCKAEIPVGGLVVISAQTRMTAIVAEISARYGVTFGDIIGRRRTQRVVEARHASIRAIRLMTGASTPAIGRFFGMNHTSILHALGTRAVRNGERHVAALS